MYAISPVRIYIYLFKRGADPPHNINAVWVLFSGRFTNSGQLFVCFRFLSKRMGIFLKHLPDGGEEEVLERNVRSAGATFNGQRGKSVKKQASFGTWRPRTTTGRRRYLDKVALLKCTKLRVVNDRRTRSASWAGICSQ